MTDLITTGLIAYALYALSAWIKYMKYKCASWTSLIYAILYCVYLVFVIKFVIKLFGFAPHTIGGIIVSLLVLALFLIITDIINFIIILATNPGVIGKAIVDGMKNEAIKEGMLSPVDENQETKRDGESVPPSASHDI